MTRTIQRPCSAMVGPGMAVAIGRAPPACARLCVLYSLDSVGFANHTAGGAGGPLAGAVRGATLAAEVGKAVSRDKEADVPETPIVTTLAHRHRTPLIAAPIGGAAPARRAGRSSSCGHEGCSLLHAASSHRGSLIGGALDAVLGLPPRTPSARPREP
ncbi:MAG: hypothetical protein ACLU38_05480 [Dysosmobacter sp.]